MGIISTKQTQLIILATRIGILFVLGISQYHLEFSLYV